MKFTTLGMSIGLAPDVGVLIVVAAQNQSICQLQETRAQSAESRKQTFAEEFVLQCKIRQWNKLTGMSKQISIAMKQSKHASLSQSIVRQSKNKGTFLYFSAVMRLSYPLCDR